MSPSPDATLDDGGKTPAPNRNPQRAAADLLVATRTSFGVTYDRAQTPQSDNSLIQEIEPGSDEESLEDKLTRPHGGFEGQFVWIATGVFLGAVGLGFFAILLWARLH